MTDEHFMMMCLKEAHVAFDSEEVPVGAIILSPEGKVIARAHNLTRRVNRPTAHAEMLAIDMAADALGNYRLVDCTLYVSMEPCIMCAGAIIEARIKRLVFGCFDAKGGAFGSVIDINALPLNHKVEVKTRCLRREKRSASQEVFSRTERYRSGHNGADSKSAVRLISVPWVRIPPSPPSMC